MAEKSLYLSTKIMITSKYKGKSKFDFWTSLQIGDDLILSVKVTGGTTRGRNGLHATDITVEKHDGTRFRCSLNHFDNYLSRLEYKQYETTYYLGD